MAPFLGEYERTATTAFNAYIAPNISSYLRKLRTTLTEKGLRREPLVMQAYGGVLGIDDACRNAVGMIESGPAAGVAGSRSTGEQLGIANILATDMGGTTFKVGSFARAPSKRTISRSFYDTRFFSLRFGSNPSAREVAVSFGLIRNRTAQGWTPRRGGHAGPDLLRARRLRGDGFRCRPDPRISQ